jgi:hypothetical protein
MHTSTLILSIALVVGSFASPVKLDLGDGVNYKVGYPIIASQANNVDGIDIVRRATTSIKITPTRKTSSSIKTTLTVKALPIATKPATTSSKKVSSTLKILSTTKSLSAALAKATIY